jgi:membrane protein required for colicin V production
MNLLDIIIITILSVFLLIGLWRGFFRAVSFFAGIVLGLWIGMTYTNDLAALIKPQIPSLPDSVLQIICFSLLFISIIFLCNVIGWGLQRLFKKTFLGWLDKLLGALFASGAGIILIYLIIVVLTFFLPAKTPLIANSKLSPWIIKSYQSMIRLVSPEYYHSVKEKIIGDSGDRKTARSKQITDKEK